MKTYEVTLQEAVQWGLLVFLGILVLGVLLRVERRRRRRQEMRRIRRRCAQCGLLQAMEAEESKYGACDICGGVTVRGRSRKLG